MLWPFSCHPPSMKLQFTKQTFWPSLSGSEAWLLRSNFEAWLHRFKGKLDKVMMDMQPLEQEPRRLQGQPCMQQVSDLHLSFSKGRPDTEPHWCPGYFQRLEKLHLEFGAMRYPCKPQWDFSTCTCLQILTLCISSSCRYPHMPAFRGITGISADLFRLVFECPMNEYCPGFSCATWKVPEVHILYKFLDQEGLPQCVTDCMGALLCSRVVPQFLLNGKSPADAAASAAAISAAAA